MASMLARSSSSRRRRASRSAGSAAASPQRSLRNLAAPEPAASARRASVSEAPAAAAAATAAAGFNRSPRGSFAEPEPKRSSPRNSVVPELLRTSPRNSVVGEPGGGNLLRAEHSRSARNSLVGGDLLDPDAYLRSGSRHSLAPDYNRSPRNSLVGGGDANNRNASRNNLTTDYNRSPRNSLVPDVNNRSARNSLVPEHDRSPRKSLVPDYDRSARNSIVPDYDRSARNSIVPDYDRSARNSIVPDYDRSARNSIVPDYDRSPRGSLVPDVKRVSPRGSIVQEHERSPRHSVSEASRSPRGSLVPGDFSRSPRASLVPDASYLRSPRTSLGEARAPGTTITFECPPGGGGDEAEAGPSGVTRASSPYRLSVTPRGAQINLGYNGLDPNSRRASSNVSQVSADDRRRLCERSKLSGAVGVLRLTAYGSVVYQLKDANMEASGTIDFVIRALRIVYKTVAVTVLLICLTSLPLLMLIMGIQFVRDCPVEPRLPVYMLVGGCTAIVRMCWLLYSQIKSRRYERLDLAVPVASLEDGFLTPSAGSRVASLALNAFLIAWFVLGNFWITHIYWPEFHPTLFEPNRWCSKTLYVFALVHLGIVYSIVGVLLVFIVGLMLCQLFSCPLLRRYK